jgi:hypothetical protein
MRVILSGNVRSPVTVVMYVPIADPMSSPRAMLVTKYPHIILRFCFSAQSATREENKKHLVKNTKNVVHCSDQSVVRRVCLPMYAKIAALMI